jgi:hypothetical protein
MATFSYKCPNCDQRFAYTPNYEREIGHRGHECLGCQTVMIWDDPDMSGQPQECTHVSLRKAGSIMPTKAS